MPSVASSLRVGLLLFLSGVGFSQTQSAELPVDAASKVSLRLGIGDLVEVGVYGIPELTSKTRVDGNGEIYFPLISQVKVAGLTVKQAEEVIEEHLSSGHYLKDPHVSLFVQEYATAGASVLGEVTKPGVYPVLGPQSLFDLISQAGGLTDRAGHSATVTHRGQSDKPVTVSLSRNLADSQESNIAVQPGDIIIVRKADIVYVVGDVARPSGLLMDSGGLTVLRAVALSGGTNRTAKLGSVRILRKGTSGLTETSVNLKNILQAKTPDIEMQADDVLVVPTSSGKVLAGRTLEAAMQTVTLISVAAIP